MYLSKTKKRLLQWSMLSVLIAMLSPAAYAACPHGDFSTVKRITHSYKSYPKNTKGAVFLFHKGYPDRYTSSSDSRLNLFSDKDKYGNNKDQHYVLPGIPTPLTANQFQIIDMTNNKQLTPKLVRLSALDAFPINAFDEGYQNSVYYLKANRRSHCDKGKPLDTYSFDEFSKLLSNKQLVEVTNEVKKTWGYFRVEPEEGLQVGHVYQFSYTGAVINDEKESYSAFMRIGPESIDLEADVSKIEPVTYEGYVDYGRRNLAYFNFSYYISRSNSGPVKYYLPPSLRQYDSQLQVFSLRKSGRQGADDRFDSIGLIDYDMGEGDPEFMVKNFSGSPDFHDGGHHEFYLLGGWLQYDKHKAKVGFLEVEDQLYDTQTKTFFTKERSLYD